MTPLFKKLNFKNQSHILVLNAPDSLQGELQEMQALTTVITNDAKLRHIDFVMVFAIKQKDIDNSIKKIAPKLNADAVLWYCYPKGTSKKYNCEFNRDAGWTALGAYNLEGVRMVAIDEDWSALRFRKLEYIKTMTRSAELTLSDTGRQRAKKKGKN